MRDQRPTRKEHHTRTTQFDAVMPITHLAENGVMTIDTEELRFVYAFSLSVLSASGQPVMADHFQLHARAKVSHTEVAIGISVIDLLTILPRDA